MKPQLATSNERHDSTKISLPATKRVKGQNMKRTGISILLFATLLAANVVAQTVHGLPPAKEQLKILTDKLGLTADQQSKAEPIIRDLHDATLKRVRPLRLNADKKLREILSDDQKKKLDAYEHGPHDEMHGELTGHPSAEPPPKQ
jgi:hypothetical protein